MKLGVCPAQGDGHGGAMLEQVRFADRNGFDAVFFQEHHEDPDQHWPDPLTACAAAAAVTDDVRVGTAVALLPLYEPVRLAGQGAMVQNLSDGRLVLGAGVGWRERTFRLMDVSHDERGRVFEETLRTVTTAWSGEEPPLAATGDPFRCEPRLDDRPDVWVGGYAQAALERAARFAEAGLADAWFPGTQPDLDGLRRRRAFLDDELEARSVDPSTVAFPLLRDGVIASDAERAEALVREHALPAFDRYYGEEAADEPGKEDGAVTKAAEGDLVRDLIDEHLLVGTPADWLAAIDNYAGIGIDTLLVRIYFEGMPADVVHRQLELIADEVLPEL